MNTAKLSAAAGTSLSAFAGEAESGLVLAVERDFPLAAKAICDPWNADWAHLPSTHAVWSEPLECFINIDWRGEDHHWYLRVCAFELLRTDGEGDDPCAARLAGPGGGPSCRASRSPRDARPYGGRLALAAVSAS